MVEQIIQRPMRQFQEEKMLVLAKYIGEERPRRHRRRNRNELLGHRAKLPVYLIIILSIVLLMAE